MKAAVLTSLFTLSLGASLGRVSPAHAEEVAAAARPDSPAWLGLEVQLGGGSVVAWDAGGETGNAFGGTILVGFGDFAAGIGLAAVMPDSRLQGEFGAFWAEGRWLFLGREATLSPYALVGLGFATADGFELGGTGFVPARWSSALGFVGMVGAGARLGEATGMFLAADVRAWNHTHLGFQLLAGYRFF